MAGKATGKAPAFKGAAAPFGSKARSVGTPAAGKMTPVQIKAAGKMAPAAAGAKGPKFGSPEFKAKYGKK